MIETALQHLALPTTIRSRAHQLLKRASAGESQHFLIDAAQMDSCADQVIAVMTRNYPSLDVPFHSRWRHFEAGGIDRRKHLLEKIDSLHPTPDLLEQARVMVDLVVTSVLLDAGSGPNWEYTGLNLNQTMGQYTRSEGLGVASFDAFMDGLKMNGKFFVLGLI